MHAARDAMENAICDYQEMTNSYTSTQALSERLHSYINNEHGTTVRHLRIAEQTNGMLRAENAELRRQLAVVTAAANISTNTLSIPLPLPSPSSAPSPNSKGIVISVAPLNVSTTPSSSLAIVSPTTPQPVDREATPRYGQLSSNTLAIPIPMSNGIVKSPSTDGLPTLRRSLSKDNNSGMVTSPSSPVDADSVLRALEAKLAKHIGEPLLSPNAATTVVPLSTSPKSPSPHDITISVTKLTRRHSSNSNRRNSGVTNANDLLRTRSTSCDEVSLTSSAPAGAHNLSSVPRRGSGKRNSRSISPKGESTEQLQQVTSLVSTPRSNSTSNLTISLNQRTPKSTVNSIPIAPPPKQLSPSSSSRSSSSPANNNSTAADIASLAMLRVVRDEWSTSSQRIRC
jgi:hypothetical protein